MAEIVDFLQAFLQELLVLIAPILAGFVAAALTALTKKWLAELEASKPKLADALKEAVSLAVQAAEQAGAASLIGDKKDYAMAIAQKFLNDNGWDEIDLEVLSAAIEAEVNKLYPNEGAERVGDTLVFAEW